MSSLSGTRSEPYYGNPDTFYINMDDVKAKEIQSNRMKKHCFCNNKLIIWLWPFISFILSYIVLMSMIIEVILLIRVYPKDSPYFISSITFLTVPTLSASWCTFRSREATYNVNEATSNRWYLCLPIINIPIYKTLVISGKMDDSETKRYSVMAMDFALTFFMILPLYCLNISYLLNGNNNIHSYKQIPIENLIQFIFSFINIVFNPIKYTLSINKPRSYEYNNNRRQMNTWNASRQIEIFCAASFVLIPLITIELIHFIPLLFAYHFDHLITHQEFVHVLLIFNIPKILFIWKRIFVFSCCEMCRYYIVPMFCPSADSEYDIDEGGYRLCCVTIILFFSYIIMPMIPYQVTIIDNIRHKKKEEMKCCTGSYIITMIYLFISYGGSSAYIIVNHGFFNLSICLQIVFIILYVLIIFSFFTLPIAYKEINKKRIAMF